MFTYFKRLALAVNDGGLMSSGVATRLCAGIDPSACMSAE